MFKETMEDLATCLIAIRMEGQEHLCLSLPEHAGAVEGITCQDEAVDTPLCAKVV
jgi:hypothetical protein